MIHVYYNIKIISEIAKQRVKTRRTPTPYVFLSRQCLPGIVGHRGRGCQLMSVLFFVADVTISLTPNLHILTLFPLCDCKVSNQLSLGADFC